MENFEIEKNTTPVDGATPPVQPPVGMPTPAPMPVAEPIVMSAPIPTPEVAPIQQEVHTEPMIERVETPIETIMQPIDLSNPGGMQSQPGNLVDGGKNKLIVIVIVVVVGLLAGVGGFFAWRMMNAPVEEAPIVEEIVENKMAEVPTTTPVIAPEADDITVIEKELNSFNATDIELEAQGGLNEINAAL